MKLPKWHERAESSDIKIKDQDILDGKNFLKFSICINNINYLLDSIFPTII